ncbi:hypothetical protein DEJ44_33195 [Streptomyces venezuelae]|uniref:hypothetical protein n=1 Tax=Streptomyces venezuelae TaxID=54571 RepID=UPI00123C5976|nr:hypothetical protein [Streptomyces venezuelae]QES10011.1 hypothetical protein DEJ44_33195 [Streptomyces venezuelae]
MGRVRAVVAAVVLVSAVAGCGSAEPSDQAGASGRPSGGASPDGTAPVGPPSAPPTAGEKLAADPGTRYKTIAVPQLEGLVCDEGDGGFHFGSDLDMTVTGDDGLKEIEADDAADEVSCFGGRRNVLRKGTMSASAPMFTARTNLYANVPDPTAALNRIYDASVDLATGYGRNFTGEPGAVTSRSLVVKCRQNVTDTFPMTTCFWADYGAAGVVDFFPDDSQYVPVPSAARWTRAFVEGALPK